MSASVAGGTETAADAPLEAAPLEAEPAPDELGLPVDAVPPLVPVDATWNGAENRCGFVKSC